MLGWFEINYRGGTSTENEQDMLMVEPKMYSDAGGRRREAKIK